MTDILNLKEEIKRRISACKSLSELEEVKIRFLGKKGEITSLLRDLKNVPPDLRPSRGKQINQVKEECEREIENKRNLLKVASETSFADRERIDVTLPGRCPKIGRLHPLTKVFNQIKDIFISLGFEVEEGPEVETEYYNFEGLNIPSSHPARDEWDSFYLEEGILLRSHTSPVQLRVMEKRRPPVRVIAPGRCFRRDAIDRTHSHTFHQVEGFIVDKHITFGDLKGVLSLFAREMFGESCRMRFRPDYFPFTEPSADGAITCIICKGKGCAVCSQTGWLEIFGCGMIHPKVLENVGYNPQDFCGFAFGMGVERIAMLKYGIDDIRLFLENDIRFLEQF